MGFIIRLGPNGGFGRFEHDTAAEAMEQVCHLYDQAFVSIEVLQDGVEISVADLAALAGAPAGRSADLTNARAKPRRR